MRRYVTAAYTAECSNRPVPVGFPEIATGMPTLDSKPFTTEYVTGFAMM